MLTSDPKAPSECVFLSLSRAHEKASSSLAKVNEAHSKCRGEPTAHPCHPRDLATIPHRVRSPLAQFWQRKKRSVCALFSTSSSPTRSGRLRRSECTACLPKHHPTSASGRNFHLPSGASPAQAGVAQHPQSGPNPKASYRRRSASARLCVSLLWVYCLGSSLVCPS